MEGALPSLFSASRCQEFPGLLSLLLLPPFRRGGISQKANDVLFRRGELPVMLLLTTESHWGFVDLVTKMPQMGIFKRGGFLLKKVHT